MGAFHAQHVRGAPAHRPGHAAGHRGGRGRRAVPPGDGLGSRARTAAIRAGCDPASAPGFRPGQPGPADGRPELPAAGAVLARPAAGHGFLGTTVAEPGRVLTVTVPEPEFTGSDRLRRLAAITRPTRWPAATPGTCLTSWKRQERAAKAPTPHRGVCGCGPASCRPAMVLSCCVLDAGPGLRVEVPSG